MKERPLGDCKADASRYANQIYGIRVRLILVDY
jgi:hypothetical protein